MSGNWSRLWRVVFCLTMLALLSSVPSQTAIAGRKPPEVRGVSGGVGTGYLSIPPAAFHPRQGNYDYENSGGYLIHRDNPYGDGGYYYAAVSLPDGATLTGLSVFMNDYWAENGAAVSLVRVGNLSNSETELTSLSSSDAGYCSFYYTNTFSDALVDNFDYIYYLKFGVTDSTSPDTTNVKLCGALIDYEYSLPYASPSYLNIPAAAFTPFSGSASFINEGNHLINSSTGTQDFQAPIFLPHGSSLQGATLFYLDLDATVDGGAYPSQTNLADGWGYYASLTTQSNGGWSMYHSEITPPRTINNQINGHWAFFRLPPSGVPHEVEGKSIRLRYAPPTSTPLIDYIVVPMAAFIPWYDGFSYENHGRYLKHTSGTNMHYVAPVYLPHGKFVRKMIFYYNQIDSSPATAMLNWNLYDGNVHSMATVDSFGPGWSSSSTTRMYGSNKIDNFWRTYWLLILANYSTSAWPAAVVLEVSDALVFLPMVVK